MMVQPSQARWYNRCASRRITNYTDAQADSLVITTAAHNAGLRRAPTGRALCNSWNCGYEGAEPDDRNEACKWEAIG